MAASVVPDFSKTVPQLLLSVDKAGKFYLHKAARESLSEKCERLPIKIISVCGIYRTGKSFLLNLLADQHGKGNRFDVGSTTRACTHGIHMWVAEGEDEVTILLDCEGSGSMEGTTNRDAQIFALAVLFCSVFVFNSRGALDENSIQHLSLVTNLAWEVQKQANADNPPPRFMWVLRDHYLSLEDEYGTALSPDEYLAKCLEEDLSERTQEAREARTKLCQLFENRHLVPLVQPIVEEEELQNLSNMPESRLRPEFTNEVVRLRKRVYKYPVKRGFQGTPMLPQQWWAFMEACVEAMNNNGCPEVIDVWTAVGNKECERATELAIQTFTKAIQASEETKSLAVLEKQLAQAYSEAIIKYKMTAMGDNIEEYQNELDNDLREQIERIMRGREEELRDVARKKLVRVWQTEIVDPLEVNKRTKTVFDLDAAMEKVRKDFVNEFFELEQVAQDIFMEYIDTREPEARALIFVAAPPRPEVARPSEKRSRKEEQKMAVEGSEGRDEDVLYDGSQKSNRTLNGSIIGPNGHPNHRGSHVTHESYDSEFQEEEEDPFVIPRMKEVDVTDLFEDSYKKRDRTSIGHDPISMRDVSPTIRLGPGLENPRDEVESRDQNKDALIDELRRQLTEAKNKSSDSLEGPDPLDPNVKPKGKKACCCVQ